MSSRLMLLGGVLTAVILCANAVSARTPGPVPSIGSCIDFGTDMCSDADGDGFIIEVERAARSDPLDPGSTPEYGLIDEQWEINTCVDGLDNDLDGRSDQADPGCHVTCKDFTSPNLCKDRDGDGWIGYVEELRGSDPNDRASTPEFFDMTGSCNDGVDNDLDGWVDAEDDGCGAPF